MTEFDYDLLLEKSDLPREFKTIEKEEDLKEFFDKLIVIKGNWYFSERDDNKERLVICKCYKSEDGIDLYLIRLLSEVPSLNIVNKKTLNKVSTFYVRLATEYEINKVRENELFLKAGYDREFVNHYESIFKNL